MCRVGRCWIPLVASIIFLFAMPLAHSQALPAYTGLINKSIGSITKFKLNKFGFAANDPRVTATLGAVGAGLTTAAGTVAATAAVGGIAAVSWPAVLAGAGISALVSGAVALAPNLIDWLWGDNQQAQVSGSALNKSGESAPPMPSTFVALLDTYGVGQDLYFYDSSVKKYQHVKTIQYQCSSSSYCSLPSPWTGSLDYTFTTAYSGPIPGTNGYWGRQYTRTVAGNPYTHQLVYVFSPPSGTLISVPTYTPTMQPVTQTVTDVLQNTNVETLSSPVSDKMLADIVNTSWRTATASDALPWSASNPITPADVAQWRSLNPDALTMPTINDFLSPVTPQGSTTIDITPSTSTNTTTTPSTPGNGTPIDFGTDPNTPAPILEDTPTIQMVLSPLLNLMPDLKNIQIASRAGACPTPSFMALGKQYTIDSHCIVIQQHSATISAAMALVWSILALLIVLRA